MHVHSHTHTHAENVTLRSSSAVGSLQSVESMPIASSTPAELESNPLLTVSLTQDWHGGRDTWRCSHVRDAGIYIWT